MKPVHIVTDKKVSELVLMPGDPLRAKYIAENFLDNAELINTVRNMYGYTGTYKGVTITVMGSGMGIPSMGLYSYELVKFYGVKKIIRIGSAGALSKDVHIKDLVIATDAYSTSSFAKTMSNDDSNNQKASLRLIAKFKETTTGMNNVKFGSIITSDIPDLFVGLGETYNILGITEDDVLAAEMETFGLYHMAKVLDFEAASIVTISDSKFEPEKNLSTEERQESLNNMIKLALDTIIK